MTDNKFLTYFQEVEIMHDKMFDVFYQYATVSYPHLNCKKCPYYNKNYKVCMITEILKFNNIIQESDLCYYNSILNLVDKYYPEFNNILYKTVNDFIGRKLDNMMVAFLNDELKKNLSFKYIDDMLFESICTDYNLKVDIIFKFKNEIIYQIIDKIYEEIKETESLQWL